MPDIYSGDHKFVQNNAAFLLANLSIPLLICSRSVRRKLDGSPPRTNYMKREELLQLYREEKDPSVKDRLMLTIKAKFDDASITKAAGSLGRVTSWGSKWFNRFARDGVERLRNLPKCGRPPLITEEESERIQNELDGKNYWTVGKARELISKGTGVTYSISSVYRLLSTGQNNPLILAKNAAKH